MAKSTYEIVVETTYKGQGAKTAAKDLKTLSSEVDTAAKKTVNFQRDWAKFATQAAGAGAVLAGVGLAAKAAYEYIGQGAELSAATGKFDNLAVSIGTVGDGLLGKMRDATKGMISDANLIASGTDIMSLGLAKTESGVVRMASAVGALNLDMQVLALTLANDSTARLDNLGLSLEAVTKKKKELIASGFIGDAFDEAVLIELEKKMTLLGDASETTAGKMQILEANLANVKDGMALMVVESVAAQKGIENLSGVVTGFNALQEAKLTTQEKLSEAVRRGIVTQEGANVILRQAIRGDEIYVDRLKDVISELERQEEASATLSSTAAEVNAIMEDKARLLANAEDAQRRETLAQIAAIEAGETYIIATAELEDKFRQQNAALTPLEVAQRAAAQATREHAEAAAALIEEAEKAPTIMETYADALENADRAASTGAGGRENYRQSMEDLANNADVAAQRVDNLAMKILGVPTSVTTTFNVNTSGAIAAIGTLENKIFGAGGAAGAGADQGTSVNAGGVGGNQGQTGAGGFAEGSSGTQSTPQLLGSPDFDPLAKGANGLNMMIPSGFPNDSFPIAAQSGEQLIIRTPQQQRDGTNTGGGGTVNINISGGDTGQIMAVVNQALAQAGVSADSRNRMR